MCLRLLLHAETAIYTGASAVLKNEFPYGFARIACGGSVELSFQIALRHSLQDNGGLVDTLVKAGLAALCDGSGSVY